MTDPERRVPVDDSAAKPLDIDVDWMLDVLVRLLRTPSPSGRTDAVMQLVGDILTDEVGVPFDLTRRGVLVASIDQVDRSAERALLVHADTIGCMVSGLKENGRLAVIPVGTFSARFAEGARVQVFTEEPERALSGTILPLKASGHAFGDEVDTQGVGWDHVEVRVDERIAGRDDLVALGIQVGDFVALDANPVLTESGYVVSRHLDGKAGVAAALAATKAVVEDVLAPIVLGGDPLAIERHWEYM